MNVSMMRGANEVASWVPPLARLGYAAKGVVYFVIGWIAAKAAFASGTPTGAEGALAEILDEQYGRVLLGVVAIGLFAHVAWRIVQAVLDPEHRREHGRNGARAMYAISALVYGSLALTALDLLRGRTGGAAGDSHWIGTLMAQPFGRILVGIVGLAVVGYGIHQLVKAFRGDVADRLGVPDAERHRAIVALGRFGTAARGVVLGLVGSFIVDAAWRYDASAAAGTEDALRWFGNGYALAVVAAGLMAYGVLQLAKALYRRIDTPRF